MICCLLSEWWVATSFYQRTANHVSFFLLFNLRNLLYLIDEIETTMTSLLELAARNDAAELCEAKFKELTQEKKHLLERLQEVRQRLDADQEKQYEIQRLMQAIDADTVDISEFSDDLVRRIVERVTVLSKDEIEVRFVGGYSKIEKLII